MKGKYNGNCEQFGFTTTIPNETSGYINVNDVKVSETENIKVANVTYEKYMEVVYENELLKQIIVELNKQLYGEAKK